MIYSYIVLILLYFNCIVFIACNHLADEESAAVVALLHLCCGCLSVGWTAVYDCGIYWSHVSVGLTAVWDLLVTCLRGFDCSL